MTSIPDDVAAEMAELVRYWADRLPANSTLGFQARAIAALLPEPVDPDLIEAREIAARRTEQRGYAAATVHAYQIRTGQRDGEDPVQIALAAIKRGRELQQAQS